MKNNNSYRQNREQLQLRTKLNICKHTLRTAAANKTEHLQTNIANSSREQNWISANKTANKHCEQQLRTKQWTSANKTADIANSLYQQNWTSANKTANKHCEQNLTNVQTTATNNKTSLRTALQTKHKVLSILYTQDFMFCLSVSGDSEL